MFSSILRIKNNLLTFRKYMDEMYEKNYCKINWSKQVLYETIEISNKRFYYSFIFFWITLHLFLHRSKAHYLQVRINISVILCFGELPIIPRHKSDRCRRNLSQSGHRNLCYLKQTLRLWFLAASRESLLRTRLSFPLTLTEYCFPEQDFLRVHLLQEQQGWRYGKKG